MKIQVYNQNKVETIICGKMILEFINEESAKHYIGHHGIHEGIRVILDEPTMKPMQFIGLDKNNEWVFSCL